MLVTILFIWVMGGAIACSTGTTVNCASIPATVFGGLVASGTIELIFEIGGIIKIYKNRREDEQDDEQK